MPQAFEAFPAFAKRWIPSSQQRHASGQFVDQLLRAAKADAEIPPFAFIRPRRLSDVFAVVFAALGHIGKIRNNHILIAVSIQCFPDGADLFRIPPQNRYRKRNNAQMGLSRSIEHVRADRFGHMLAQRDAQDGGGVGEKAQRQVFIWTYIL